MTAMMIGAKSLRRLAMPVAAIAAATGICASAQAKTVATDAQIAIVRPLTFITVEDLVFGDVIRGATAGTVTIAPNGTRTSTGGVTLIGTGFQAAKFAGQGSSNQAVDISMGATQIFVTGPGTSMRVHTWVIGSTPTAILTTNPQRFTITSPTGIFTFPLGATLDVNANQTPGTYSGTFNITLQYQ